MNKFKEYEKYAENYDETATDIWEIMWEMNASEEELNELNELKRFNEWLYGNKEPAVHKKINLKSL